MTIKEHEKKATETIIDTLVGFLNSLPSLEKVTAVKLELEIGKAIKAKKLDGMYPSTTLKEKYTIKDNKAVTRSRAEDEGTFEDYQSFRSDYFITNMTKFEKWFTEDFLKTLENIQFTPKVG